MGNVIFISISDGSFNYMLQTPGKDDSFKNDFDIRIFLAFDAFQDLPEVSDIDTMVVEHFADRFRVGETIGVSVYQILLFIIKLLLIN